MGANQIMLEVRPLYPRFRDWFQAWAFLLAMLLAFLSPPISAEIEIVRDGYVLRLNSDNPNTSTYLGFIADKSGRACLNIEVNKLSVDRLAREVQLSVARETTGFLCPFSPENFIPIGRLPTTWLLDYDQPLVWHFTVYEETTDSTTLFNSDNIIGEFFLNLNLPKSIAHHHETPAAGSIQSGLSMIRGWACNAEQVQIQFDGGEKIPLAYGSRRADTEEV